MAARKKLNVDYARAISDFQSLLKSIELRIKLYRLLFRGRGLEFDGYREYHADDDASSIDWKASTRSASLLVKQYIEERDIKIVFALDVSDSMIFGSTKKLKCEYAAELVAALGYMMVNGNDKVGYLLFNDKTVEFIPPRGGLTNFYAAMDRISESSLYGGKSNVHYGVKTLLNDIDTSVAAVVFVSDFIRVDQSLLKDLKLAAHKFEFLSIVIRDPLDYHLPDVDEEVVLEDPFTHTQMLINPKLFKNHYEHYTRQQRQILERMFKQSNIDSLFLETNKSFAAPLVEFLKMRLEERRVVV